MCSTKTRNKLRKIMVLRKQVIQHRKAAKRDLQHPGDENSAETTAILRARKGIRLYWNRRKKSSRRENTKKKQIMDRLLEVLDNVERNLIVPSESLEVETSTQETKQNSIWGWEGGGGSNY